MQGAAGDRNVVVLNDIHIDIMDYIVPATCTETEFRSMWAEFEWENKVRLFFWSLGYGSVSLKKWSGPHPTPVM